MSEKTSQTGRTRQPKSVRESDILTAAYAIFSTKGYGKAAMSEMAKSAGVSEGTIYKYFPSKQDLLARVIASFYKKLINNTQNSLIGIKGVENQLRVVISRHIHNFFEDIGMYRLLLQEVRPLNNYPNSEMHQLTRQYSEILLDVIKGGVATGEIRADVSAKLVRDMIFGCLEHAGWNVLTTNKAPLDRDKLTQDILVIILNGLTPPVPVAPPIQQSKDFDRNLQRLEQLVDRLENT